MITYDRNRNPITNGSQVMINGTGKTGKIIAIHATGLTPAQLRRVIRQSKWKGRKVSSSPLN